uniref:Uncharacterized protein n=1 Tax=Streptomyces sp. F12 TaxID=1436084 RepID=V9Z8A9_9ACTN|nr:hypothetical protein pFRL6_157 [Streptomyces sp. F12]
MGQFLVKGARRCGHREAPACRARPATVRLRQQRAGPSVTSKTKEPCQPHHKPPGQNATVPNLFQLPGRRPTTQRRCPTSCTGRPRGCVSPGTGR